MLSGMDEAIATYISIFVLFWEDSVTVFGLVDITEIVFEEFSVFHSHAFWAGYVFNYVLFWRV